MSIPTVAPDPTHPAWCALARCTAFTDVYPMAQHRSEPVVLDLSAMQVTLQLVQSAETTPFGGTPFLVAVTASNGLTLSTVDAWTLVDAATELLERVR